MAAGIPRGSATSAKSPSSSRKADRPRERHGQGQGDVRRPPRCRARRPARPPGPGTRARRRAGPANGRPPIAEDVGGLARPRGQRRRRGGARRRAAGAARGVAATSGRRCRAGRWSSPARRPSSTARGRRAARRPAWRSPAVALVRRSARVTFPTRLATTETASSARPTRWPRPEPPAPQRPGAARRTQPRRRRPRQQHRQRRAGCTTSRSVSRARDSARRRQGGELSSGDEHRQRLERPSEPGRDSSRQERSSGARRQEEEQVAQRGGERRGRVPRDQDGEQDGGRPRARQGGRSAAERRVGHGHLGHRPAQGAEREAEHEDDGEVDPEERPRVGKEAGDVVAALTKRLAELGAEGAGPARSGQRPPERGALHLEELPLQGLVGIVQDAGDPRASRPAAR